MKTWSEEASYVTDWGHRFIQLIEAVEKDFPGIGLINDSKARQT
jgi:hypothetical protein